MNVVANNAEELGMSEVEEQTGEFCTQAIKEVHLYMEQAKYKYKLQLIVECKQMFGGMYNTSEMERLQKLIKKYRRKVSELDSKIISLQLSKGETASKLLNLGLNREKYNEMLNWIEEGIEFETTPMSLEQIKWAYNLTEKKDDERLKCIM